MKPIQAKTVFLGLIISFCFLDSNVSVAQIANRGDPQAANKGRAVAVGPPKSVELLESECSSGNMASCVKFGDALLWGRGVPKDEPRGLDLQRKACDAGNGAGCDALFHPYTTGRGVAADPKRGYEYLERACSLNYIRSCGFLGHYLISGAAMGVYAIPKNFPRGMALLNRSCDSNFFMACTWVGEAYDPNRPWDQGGVVKSQARALFFYERSCLNGEADGCENASELLITENSSSADRQRGLRLLSHGCRNAQQGERGMMCEKETEARTTIAEYEQEDLTRRPKLAADADLTAKRSLAANAPHSSPRRPVAQATRSTGTGSQGGRAISSPRGAPSANDIRRLYIEAVWGYRARAAERVAFLLPGFQNISIDYQAGVVNNSTVAGRVVIKYEVKDVSCSGPEKGIFYCFYKVRGVRDDQTSISHLNAIFSSDAPLRRFDYFAIQNGRWVSTTLSSYSNDMQLVATCEGTPYGSACPRPWELDSYVKHGKPTTW